MAGPRQYAAANGHRFNYAWATAVQPSVQPAAPAPPGITDLSGDFAALWIEQETRVSAPANDAAPNIANEHATHYGINYGEKTPLQASTGKKKQRKGRKGRVQKSAKQTGAKRGGDKWTEEDENILWRLHTREPPVPYEEIARVLGRTRTVISLRLKIHKTKKRIGVAHSKSPPPPGPALPSESAAQSELDTYASYDQNSSQRAARSSHLQRRLPPFDTLLRDAENSSQRAAGSWHPQRRLPPFDTLLQDAAGRARDTEVAQALPMTEFDRRQVRILNDNFHLSSAETVTRHATRPRCVCSSFRNGFPCHTRGMM